MTNSATPATPPTAGEPVSEATVLVRREGVATRITLNRPRAMNALTRDMVMAVAAGVETAQRDGSTVIMLDAAGDRGYCGGGDVKAMAANGREQALAFLWEEYRADHAIHVASLPVVSFMDGITMGGGIGLTAHATYRVVTERSKLAMPETRIGIVPDVGGNLLLSRAPGFFGELIALPSRSFDAGAAIALGFADYFVPSERLHELQETIASTGDAEAALEHFGEAAPASPLLDDAAWWNPIAEQVLADAEQVLADPVAAAVRLIATLESSADERARQLAAEIRAVSPTSAAVSLWQITQLRAAPADLAQVLTDDYRVLGRLFAHGDFNEGVRALLIDKDGAPAWAPATLEQLEPADILQIVSAEFRPGERPLSFSNQE